VGRLALLALGFVFDQLSISVKTRPAKTWGPVDGLGHAMFGWPMEEEAKLEFTITVNWRRKDGSIATTQLGTLDRGACRSAEDVGLQLADAKPILGRLQEIVVSQRTTAAVLRSCAGRVPAVIVSAT
jgi:hypothetical protein